MIISRRADPCGATALGLLPIAIAAAAFLVPLAYLVYIDDVNLWEEAPAAVVVGPVRGHRCAGAAGLAVLLRLGLRRRSGRSLRRRRARPVAGSARCRSRRCCSSRCCCRSSPRSAKNLFAVLLAARPQFDDMIDGLTFGVAAGTAYAAFETIVVYSSVFTAEEFRTDDGHRLVDGGRAQHHGREVADLRHRDRHRGGRVLRQGRGLRRLHAGLLRELRPRGGRQHRLLGGRPADGVTCRSATRSAWSGAS